MKVNSHSANVFIMPKGKRILIGVYDDRYPVSVFSGHFNILGGNCQNDGSPHETLIRELTEEMKREIFDEDETIGRVLDLVGEDVKNDEYLIGREFAPDEVMVKFRDEIIKNLKPFGDFLLEIEKGAIGTKDDFKSIQSIFVSEVSDEVFDEVCSFVNNGKQVVNEGFVREISVDDMIKGEIRGAWGDSTIISKILGVEIPEYEFVRCTLIGEIKDSFEEYKKEYEYRIDPEK